MKHKLKTLVKDSVMIGLSLTVIAIVSYESFLLRREKPYRPIDF